MPMPFTRPIKRYIATPTVGTYPKGGTAGAGLALPPSHGTALPYGAGTLHTVKNPAHQIPTTPRVAPAGVT
jgi:hypothetical protein